MDLTKTRPVLGHENYVIDKNGNVYNIKKHNKPYKIKTYYDNKGAFVHLSTNGKTTKIHTSTILCVSFYDDTEEMDKENQAIYDASIKFLKGEK